MRAEGEDGLKRDACRAAIPQRPASETCQGSRKLDAVRDAALTGSFDAQRRGLRVAAHVRKDDLIALGQAGEYLDAVD
jgi:hypothetical protein